MGKIKQTNSGSWTTVLSISKYTGIPNDQKRLTAKTKRELNDKVLAELNKLKDGVFVKNDNATFSNYLMKYKKRMQNPQIVEKSTYVRYERMWRLHIEPVIGEMRIQKINLLVIQNLIDSLLEKDFARKSIYLVITILNGVFKIAIKEGVIKEIPFKYEDLILPKKTKRAETIWEEKHIEKFLAFGENVKKRGKYYVAVLMALMTGMRKGEILGLTWDKVDLENKIIYVQQILESNGRDIKPTTKTGIYRQIAFDDLLKEELIRHKEFQKTDSPNNPLNLVFCTRTGKTVIENTLNDVLHSYSEKLNLPKIRFHDTRHSHFTFLIQNGANIKQVQERAGHKKASMTLDVYSHVIPNQQQYIVETLNKKFRKPDFSMTNLSDDEKEACQ